MIETMEPPPIPRILATALVLLAVAGVFLALLAPWGGYEAEGRFSSSGCSGDVAVSDYHLRHLTRTLRASDPGADPCPTTIIVRFDALAADPSPITQERNPGAGELAQAFPLVVAGAALGVLALAFGVFAMDRGAPWTFFAAGVAFLAFLGMLGGTTLYQLGIGEQIEWERTAPQGDLRGDPGAWSWGPGLFGAYAAVVLLLASAVVGFLPQRRAVPDDDGPRDEDADPPEGEGSGTGGAIDAPPPAPRDATDDVDAGPSEDAFAGPAGADDAEEPRPRRLKCPECEHRFMGAWGSRPVCPACGFSKV